MSERVRAKERERDSRNPTGLRTSHQPPQQTQITSRTGAQLPPPVTSRVLTEGQRSFELMTGVRRQASSVKRQASGDRRPLTTEPRQTTTSTAFLVLLLLPILLLPILLLLRFNFAPVKQPYIKENPYKIVKEWIK